MSSLVRTVTPDRGLMRRRTVKSRRPLGRSSFRNGVYRTFAVPRNAFSQEFDPFPAKMRSVLRYTDDVVLGGTPGGTVSSFYFRANDLLPNVTNPPGHLCYGYDTLKSIYNQYQVKSSTITLALAQGATTAGCVWGLNLVETIPVTMDRFSSFEQKGSNLTVNSGAPSLPVQLMKKYSLRSFPSNNQEDRSGRYDPGNVAFPQQTVNNPAFFQILLKVADPAAAVPLIRLQVAIEYHVESFDMKDLGPSVLPPFE